MTTLKKVEARLTEVAEPQKQEYGWAVMMESPNQKLKLGVDCIRLTKKFQKVPGISVHAVPGVPSSFGSALLMIVGPTKQSVQAALRIYDKQDAEIHFPFIRKFPHI